MTEATDHTRVQFSGVVPSPREPSTAVSFPFPPQKGGRRFKGKWEQDQRNRSSPGRRSWEGPPGRLRPTSKGTEVGKPTCQVFGNCLKTQGRWGCERGQAWEGTDGVTAGRDTRGYPGRSGLYPGHSREPTKSVKGRGVPVGSMNKKLLSNTSMTNASLESDYLERLGCHQRKPRFVSSTLPLQSHGCQTSPELAPNGLPRVLRSSFASCTLGKVWNPFFLREIKKTNLYTF